MEVRKLDSQAGIEPDSWKGCRYSVSFHHLAAVAAAYDFAVAQSACVAVYGAAAVVGRPAVGRHVPAAGS